MAMIDRTRPAPFGAITVFQIVSAFASLYDGFRSRMAARRTARVLSALSDRQLEDVGLTRGDVERMAER
ncbi:MAG: DUF1127 domain-containing protein [Pseudomonadota bacterium]